MWVLLTLAFVLALKIYTLRTIRDLRRRIAREKHELKERREVLGKLKRQGTWVADEAGKLTFKTERMRQTIEDLNLRLGGAGTSEDAVAASMATDE